jgi:A/G-specific adenine glycosylase
MAFNQPTPILDGNVVRVLARLFGLKGNPREKTANRQLWALAGELVSAAARASDTTGWACSHLNQALMELGAIVCTPAQPKCPVCPVRAHCVAHTTGCTENLPNLPRRNPSTARHFAAFVVQHRGRLLVRQRPTGEVNAHLWEFPNVELFGNAASLGEIARNMLKTTPASVQPLCIIKHTITRYRITLDAYHVRLKRPPGKARGNQWLTLDEVKRLPLTSAHRKILRIKLETGPV